MRRRRPGDGDDRRAARLTHHELAAEWGLALGEPFPLALHSYVAPAGEGAVLKLVPPEDDESAEEPDALELWAGDGAVRLLRHDRSRRALLLERARPGDDLSALAEPEATAALVAVARRLWIRGQSPGFPFRSVHERVPRVPPVLWNPLPCRLRAEHLESRIAAFVAAGLDEERIRAWTVIRGSYLLPEESEALLALV